jgi:hypothetical protein
VIDVAWRTVVLEWRNVGRKQLSLEPEMVKTRAPRLEQGANADLAGKGQAFLHRDWAQAI